MEGSLDMVLFHGSNAALQPIGDSQTVFQRMHENTVSSFVAPNGYIFAIYDSVIVELLKKPTRSWFLTILSLPICATRCLSSYCNLPFKVFSHKH